LPTLRHDSSDSHIAACVEAILQYAVDNKTILTDDVNTYVRWLLAELIDDFEKAQD